MGDVSSPNAWSESACPPANSGEAAHSEAVPSAAVPDQKKMLARKRSSTFRCKTWLAAKDLAVAECEEHGADEHINRHSMHHLTAVCVMAKAAERNLTSSASNNIARRMVVRDLSQLEMSASDGLRSSAFSRNLQDEGLTEASLTNEETLRRSRSRASISEAGSLQPRCEQLPSHAQRRP